MKKFLVPCLLAMMLMIPTAICAAEDVPDFREIAGRSVSTGRSSSGYGYRTYVYYCDEDDDDAFASDYADLLEDEYDFELNDYQNETDVPGSDEFERWIFEYIGSKRVGRPFSGGGSVEVYQYYNGSMTIFEIRVADGLSYGD